MTTFNDFELEISLITRDLYLKDGNVPIKKIMDALDQKYNYSKEEYTNTRLRLNSTLLNIRNKCFELFDEYTNTEDYKTRLEIAKNLTSQDEYWKEKYFKKVKGYKIFNERKIREFTPIAKVFQDWLNELQLKGIPFLISGKGHRKWRVPDFADYHQYKFFNMVQTATSAQRQVIELTKNGDARPLASGIEIKRLSDASQSFISALEYEKEETKNEGK